MRRMRLRRWEKVEKRDSRRRNFFSEERRAAARKIRIVTRGCDEKRVGTLGLWSRDRITDLAGVME
jgi:hypothetical protein